MSPDQFKEILNATEPDICKQSTQMGGELIVPVKRRALRLRFLVAGESFRSLHFQFRISSPAISYIVTEVCEAIPKKLGLSYLKVPSSEQERLQIAKQFEEKWNFPNCLHGSHRRETYYPPTSSKLRISERFSIAFTANGKRQAEISRLPKTREIYLVSAYILPVSHSYGVSTKNREIS